MAEAPPQESTPPTIPDELELLEPRPKWPTVVGWLSVVLGLLALVSNGSGIVMNVFLQSWLASVTAPAGDPLPTMTFTPAVIAFMMLKLAWGIPLVIAGIATIVRKPAGRPLHLIYVIGFSITTLIASYLGYQMLQAYINSQEVVQWLAEHPNDPRGMGLKGGMSTWMTLIGLPVSLAYPTFCLVWFAPPGRSERALRQDAEEELV
ncbi:MAG: hypothetical protein IID31_03030 [Planctomycetes bacterium]|nr:hypothetical protein [Planctomycetota bacterium]